jgi:hypothetical protein
MAINMWVCPNTTAMEQDQEAAETAKAVAYYLSPTAADSKDL